MTASVSAVGEIAAADEEEDGLARLAAASLAAPDGDDDSMGSFSDDAGSSGDEHGDGVGAASTRGRARQPRNRIRRVVPLKPSKKKKQQQDLSTQHSNNYRAVGQQFEKAAGKATSQSPHLSFVLYGFSGTQGNISLAGQIQDHLTDEVAMCLQALITQMHEGKPWQRAAAQAHLCAAPFAFLPARLVMACNPAEVVRVLAFLKTADIVSADLLAPVSRAYQAHIADKGTAAEQEALQVAQRIEEDAIAVRTAAEEVDMPAQVQGGRHFMSNTLKMLRDVWFERGRQLQAQYLQRRQERQSQEVEESLAGALAAVTVSPAQAPPPPSGALQGVTNHAQIDIAVNAALVELPQEGVQVHAAVVPEAPQLQLPAVLSLPEQQVQQGPAAVPLPSAMQHLVSAAAGRASVRPLIQTAPQTGEATRKSNRGPRPSRALLEARESQQAQVDQWSDIDGQGTALPVSGTTSLHAAAAVVGAPAQDSAQGSHTAAAEKQVDLQPSAVAMPPLQQWPLSSDTTGVTASHVVCGVQGCCRHRYL